MTRAIVHPNLFSHLAPGFFSSTCTIERDQNAGQEAHGGYPQQPDWQPLATEVTCRLWRSMSLAARASERVAPQRAMTLGDLMLALPPGTEVTTSDRVTGVTDRLGVVTAAGPLNITAVLPQLSHIRLVLQEVT